jgi:hypothetical protein
MSTARSILWFLVKFAALICMLHYLGEIPWRASGVLSYFLVAALSGRPSASSAPFTPFTFTLHPHVRYMLIDLGYIDEEALKEIQMTDQSNPWSGAYMDAQGVNGYALQRSESGWAVVHWPRLNWYTEDIGFHRNLEFMDTQEGFRSNAPSCFCRRGKEAGLAFGVSVKEDWWKANCDAIAAKGIVLDVERQYHFGTVDLTMAVLPYDVERYFSGPQLVSDYSLFEKQAKALSEKLKEKEWSEKGREGYESWMQADTIYQHRYVTVYMNHLHEVRK